MTWATLIAGRVASTVPVRNRTPLHGRADTTVIAANVAYPTDAGLLAKAVGNLVRAARRCRRIRQLYGVTCLLDVRITDLAADSGYTGKEAPQRRYLFKGVRLVSR